jgi:hypothetical protein
VTLDLPTGTQNGDYLLAVIHLPSDLSPLSGWTNLAEYSACGSMVWLGKIANGEPAAYTFPAQDPSGTDRVSGILASFAGVDPGSPVDATSSPVGCVGLGCPSEVSCAGPSVTTFAAGDLVLFGGGDFDSTGLTWSAPQGMSQLTSTGMLVLFDAPAPNAGPTHAVTTSPSGQICPCGALDVIVLRPAP